MTGFLERIYKGLATFGGWLLFGLALLITVDVLARWILGKPLGGVFEVAEISLLVVIFISLAFTQYSNRQIRIDILYSRLNPKPRGVLDIVNCLACLLFFGILLVTGGQELVAAVKGSYVRRGLVEIPLSIPFSFLVFGTIAVFTSILVIMARNVKGLFSGPTAK